MIHSYVESNEQTKLTKKMWTLIGGEQDDSWGVEAAIREWRD